MRLVGTETISAELAGSLPRARGEALLARTAGTKRSNALPLTLELDDAERSRVSVLVLAMKGLGVAGLPFGLDYHEVLYRFGVVYDGAPAWLALRCDIDRALVRKMAAAIIRYPVRSAAIDIERNASTVMLRAKTRDDVFEATLHFASPQITPEHVPPRRTLVVHREHVYEVPWAERPAPVRDRAAITVADTSACRAVFGTEVAFDDAIVHQGRTHLCGAATLIPPVAGG
jgi:hypothetical protein